MATILSIERVMDHQRLSNRQDSRTVLDDQRLCLGVRIQSKLGRKARPDRTTLICAASRRRYLTYRHAAQTA
jgi:hypothetical protein